MLPVIFLLLLCTALSRAAADPAAPKPPGISEIYPDLGVIPLTGVDGVNVTGSDFGETLRVELSKDFDKDSDTRLVGEFPVNWVMRWQTSSPVQNIYIPGKMLVKALVPGYSSIRFSNMADPSTLSTTLVDYVYATEDCPFPGQFGVGNDCRDCPQGGICPGGNRLWPMPGYWNSDESSGQLVRCKPSAACLGGRFSACAPGYKGVACGVCAGEFGRTRSGACSREFGGGHSAVLAVTLILALALLALATYAARRSSLYALPFVVQCVRLGQAYAFLVLDTRGHAESEAEASILSKDAVALVLTPLTGYVGFYGDDSAAVDALFRGFCFTWLYAVPLLIVPAIEMMAVKIAERRGVPRDGARPDVSIRGHLRRAMVTWTWLMAVPLAIVCFRTMPCQDGLMLFSTSVHCGSAQHVGAVILGTLGLLALFFALFWISRGVRRVAAATDASDIPADDYAAYAFVYGMCQPGHVGKWKLDALPSAIAVVFASFAASASLGVLGLIAALFTLALLAVCGYILARRPYRGFSNVSQILGLLNLCVIVWMPVSVKDGSDNFRLGQFFDVSTLLLWTASLVTGCVALWNARSLKTRLAFPAGYGSMDDAGTVVAMTAVTVGGAVEDTKGPGASDDEGEWTTLAQ